jgi:hypothetical protein
MASQSLQGGRRRPAEPLDSGIPAARGLRVRRRPGRGEQLPCRIVETDDAAAFLELVRSNSQGELTPLERGMHALKSGMDLKGYAEAVGR